MSKIDIIIPVYNAEKYIEATINSIKKQNYKNWKLILIDDCSTDKTREICQKLSTSDSKITYIKLKQNQGPSVARNVGIERSTAEYLSFIDSDDAIEPDYLSRLVTTAERYKADIVWCNYYEETPDKIEKRTHNLPQAPLETKQAMSFFIEGREGLGSMCNKLYRRSFVETHHCRLNPNRAHGEDWQFNMDVFRCRGRIIPIPDFLYHYIRQNKDSVISSYRSIDYDNFVRSEELKKGIAKEFDIEYNLVSVNSNFIYMVIALLHRLLKSNYGGGGKYTEFCRITQDSYFFNIIKSKAYSIKKLPLKYRIYFILLKYRTNYVAYMLMKIL